MPTAVELAGALAGITRLALTSATVAVATLKVAVLLRALLSLPAPVLPVPDTPVLVCRKLIEALTVKFGVTLIETGAAGKVTNPLAET